MLLFCLILCVRSIVILSTGIGNLNQTQLDNYVQLYAQYKDNNIITASSVLLYGLGMNGELVEYNTSVPNNKNSGAQFQRAIKKLGLKVYPCIYCDATIGACNNFAIRLDNLYKNKEKFINSTIKIALDNGWDGYTIDFEPDQWVNPIILSKFVIEWSYELSRSGLILYVWIGGPTQYDLALFSDYMGTGLKLVTMDTYVSTYEYFVETAESLFSKIHNRSNIGFGMLSYYIYSDLDKVFNFIELSNINIISLWASNINPGLFDNLQIFNKN